jgi:alkylation response protein AidB-like acyl-CoA dehydrogenase
MIAEPLELPALLAPSIRAAADDMDRRGVVPAELVTELREAGAFRLLTPRELGGFEAPLTTVLRVYEELGRIDASVAWLVWNANFGFIGALLDDDGNARLWGNGTEPVFANSGQPGVAVPADGGYRVSGNWKIVSGIDNADWLVVVAVVVQDGAPRLTEAGAPDQLTIKDTWNVSGMRATRSNDVRIDEALVPDDLVASIDRPARIDRPVYRGFMPALVIPGCTAITLAIAQRSIEETVTLATSKRTSTGDTLADLVRTQSVIAKSEAAVRAARLLLYSAAETLQAAGEQAEPVTIEDRAALRAAMSHAAQVSRECLVAMYELSSSSSLYLGNPVERLFRDGMAALQHANHSAAFFEAAGRVRFGKDPSVPLF